MLEKLPVYLTRGLGPWLESVKRPSFRELGAHAERIRIHDVELLSSYNWVDPDYPPTIMVPGGPRVLRSSIGAMQVQKSTAELRDLYPVTARLPLGASTQPMFQAVHVLRPECRFNNVDVVADRIVLLLLQDFCRRAQPNFRLNATVVHDTLVLEHCARWASKEKGTGTGYGFDFEQRMAAYPEGLEASDSHWRILRYNLGALTWVIHYESDSTTEPYGRFGEPAPRVIPARDYESATVVLRGQLTPQEQTLEMKCKTQLRNWNLAQLARRNWAGCTGYLLLGQIYEGMVERVTLGDQRQENEEYGWQKDYQQGFDSLQRLILELKQAVRRAPSGQAGLVFREYPWSRVEVFDADRQGPIVSQEMREKLWEKRRRKAKGGAVSG